MKQKRKNLKEITEIENEEVEVKFYPKMKKKRFLKNEKSMWNVHVADNANGLSFIKDFTVKMSMYF